MPMAAIFLSPSSTVGGTAHTPVRPQRREGEESSEGEGKGG